MSVVDQVKAARRVSVPILAINTPDQVATVSRIVDGVNGQVPKVQWDFIRGLRPLVPVGVRSRGEIDALRKQANGRFLSASKPGVFTLDDATTARRISLND